MILGVGTDLVDVGRFEESLRRTPSLRQRLFTPAEAELSVESLAARFAAKEAAIKALGGGCAPIDVEVVGSEPPRLLLHGSARIAAESAGVTLAVSLTHSREVAGAVVLASPAAA